MRNILVLTAGLLLLSGAASADTSHPYGYFPKNTRMIVSLDFAAAKKSGYLDLMLKQARKERDFRKTEKQLAKAKLSLGTSVKAVHIAQWGKMNNPGGAVLEGNFDKSALVRMAKKEGAKKGRVGSVEYWAKGDMVVGFAGKRLLMAESVKKLTKLIETGAKPRGKTALSRSLFASTPRAIFWMGIELPPEAVKEIKQFNIEPTVMTVSLSKKQLKMTATVKNNQQAKAAAGLVAMGKAAAAQDKNFKKSGLLKYVNAAKADAKGNRVIVTMPISKKVINAFIKQLPNM